MTDSHGRVPLQQQTGDRPADDLATPDNAGVRARYFDLAALQQLDDSRGRARNKSRPPHCQQSDIGRMKCIDVFRRIDRFDDQPVIDLFRQRQLYENTVQLTVVIQFRDQAEELLT